MTANVGLAPVVAVLLVAVSTFFGLFVAGEMPYLYHLIHDAFDPRPRALLLDSIEKGFPFCQRSLEERCTPRNEAVSLGPCRKWLP